MQIYFINIKSLNGILSPEIKKLKGEELSHINSLENAYLSIYKGKIVDFGKMEDLNLKGLNVVDVKNRMVFPSWCDSHTHLVFAKSREKEFVDRINGLTYEEIALKGGGILNSAQKLAEMSEEELLKGALVRLNEIEKLGTGAVEIKSGYGLTLEGELKSLRVIKRLKEVSNSSIKATFLGAHAIPTIYKNSRDKYIDLIINEMLPIIEQEKLADFIDVFCETNYYTPEETNRILEAGLKHGLKPKIHVNQFTSIGGIQVGIKNNALSVDHLEVMTKEDIFDLKNSSTMPTLLPSCSFFLGIPYAPAKELIKANLPIALASDYNPGSTPSGNMNFVVSLACIKMRLTPSQAINAATINGAFAMELENEVGSITIGKKANFYITKPMEDIGLIPYYFGNNQIESCYLNGVKIS